MKGSITFQCGVTFAREMCGKPRHLYDNTYKCCNNFLKITVLGSMSECGTQILDLNYVDRELVIKGLIIFAFTGIVAN